MFISLPLLALGLLVLAATYGPDLELLRKPPKVRTPKVLDENDPRRWMPGDHYR